jgi:hypothetical protein
MNGQQDRQPSQIFGVLTNDLAPRGGTSLGPACERIGLAHASSPVYLTVLGPRFESLPLMVKMLHDTRPGRNLWRGQAQVRRGCSLLSRLVAGLIGFPSAGEDVPLQVLLERSGGREKWVRWFKGERFHSSLLAGTGRHRGLVEERFGPLRFQLAVLADCQGLSLSMRGWSLWRLPLPLSLAPSTESHEREESGRFCFDVEIHHQFTGLIVAYRGWLFLEPEALPIDPA